MLYAQLSTPLEQSEYKTLTSNADLVSYVRGIAKDVPFITMDTMAISQNGKVVPVVFIANDGKPAWKRKLLVMIFAQQHGNEQSGKEGALLLLKDFAEGAMQHLLDNVSVILVPQMNPDGSDADVRRNGNNMDLNRNHLILTEPEAAGLHALYARYDPDVTLDVHEYSPYGRAWERYGFRENSDETFGTLTNINTDAALRGMQRKEFLPFIGQYLHAQGYSFSEYNVGGPPNVERIRNSTVDINDGRQSFGILGSLSFILEGKNGRDSIDNIKRRAEGQYTAMKGLLTFVSNNAERIGALTSAAKMNVQKQKKVAIQMEHVGEGPQPQRYLSFATQQETTVIIDNYHTKVEARLSVQQPKGYLIPKSDSLLVDLLKKHSVSFMPYTSRKSHVVMRYIPEYGKKPVFEEFELPVSSVTQERVKNIVPGNYYYVPVEQRASTMLTLAFEPQSMINLLQYDRFAYLMKEKFWPILRVE